MIKPFIWGIWLKIDFDTSNTVDLPELDSFRFWLSYVFLYCVTFFREKARVFRRLRTPLQRSQHPKKSSCIHQTQFKIKKGGSPKCFEKNLHLGTSDLLCKSNNWFSIWNETLGWNGWNFLIAVFFFSFFFITLPYGSLWNEEIWSWLKFTFFISRFPADCFWN